MKRTTDRCVSLEMQCAMNQSGKNSPIAQRPAPGWTIRTSPAITPRTPVTSDTVGAKPMWRSILQ